MMDVYNRCWVALYSTRWVDMVQDVYPAPADPVTSGHSLSTAYLNLTKYNLWAIILSAFPSFSFFYFLSRQDSLLLFLLIPIYFHFDKRHTLNLASAWPHHFSQEFL